MVTEAPTASRATGATRWEHGYALRLVTDVLAVAGAVLLLAQYVRFGRSPLMPSAMTG